MLASIAEREQYRRNSAAKLRIFRDISLFSADISVLFYSHLTIFAKEFRSKGVSAALLPSLVGEGSGVGSVTLNYCRMAPKLQTP